MLIFQGGLLSLSSQKPKRQADFKVAGFIDDDQEQGG